MDWRRADDSLPAGHRGECAVRLQQFLVAALLDDAAFGEDDDVVHRRERREPMDDANDGAMLGQRVDGRLHFGLGRASTADISIRWLDGKVENFRSVPAGEIVTIEEGKGIVREQPYSAIKK